MIIVDALLNKGKPSIQNSFGKMLTVKGIVNMFVEVLKTNDRGLIEETLKEFGLTALQVRTAIAYSEKYPAILQAE